MDAGRSFEIDVLRFGVKILVLVIAFGLVLGQDNARYHGNPDSMLFPGPVSRRSEEADHEVGPTERGSNLSRSLELAKEIDSMNTIEDFLSLVRGVPQDEKTFLVASRFDDGSERSNAIQATPAKCTPELQAVPLKQDDDPSTLFYPTCTRIKRCGGCCSHSLLSCQPTGTRIINFEVLVTTVGTSHELLFKGKQIVPLEEHTSCKCDCKVKEEHCTEKQVYLPEECRCSCTNYDEMEKCSRNNETKLWDPDLCTCLCRTVQECNTGFYFDHNTCSCRQVALSKLWFAPSKGTDYRFGQTQKPDVPPVIVPLDASDPRRKPKDDPEYK